jgi:hypothetical protein
VAHDGKAVHRSVVAVDVEGFGARTRTDADRLDVRSGIHRALREAFGTAGVDLSSCHVDDRGDGGLVLVPPEVPKATLVGLLPRALADALARHNEAAEPGAAMLMRMAVHAGEVTFDAHGVTGSAVVHAFRMHDAPRVRAVLAVSDASVVLVVSAWIRDEVVRHLEPRISARFTADEVTVKETTAPVWVRLFPEAASEQVYRGMPQRPAGDWKRHAYVNHDKLFGAQHTIDTVAAAITNERGDHVVSVVGEGGVGKTAISYEAVQAAIDSGGFTQVAWVSATKPHSGAGNSGVNPIESPIGLISSRKSPLSSAWTWDRAERSGARSSAGAWPSSNRASGCWSWWTTSRPSRTRRTRYNSFANSGSQTRTGWWSPPAGN